MNDTCTLILSCLAPLVVSVGIYCWGLVRAAQGDLVIYADPADARNSSCAAIVFVVVPPIMFMFGQTWWVFIGGAAVVAFFLFWLVYRAAIYNPSADRFWLALLFRLNAVLLQILSLAIFLVLAIALSRSNEEKRKRGEYVSDASEAKEALQTAVLAVIFSVIFIALEKGATSDHAPPYEGIAVPKSLQGTAIVLWAVTLLAAGVPMYGVLWPSPAVAKTEARTGPSATPVVAPVATLPLDTSVAAVAEPAVIATPIEEPLVPSRPYAVETWQSELVAIPGQTDRPPDAQTPAPLATSDGLAVSTGIDSAESKTSTASVAAYASASRTPQRHSASIDGAWPGTYHCGPVLGPNSRNPNAFSAPVTLIIEHNQATLARNRPTWHEVLTGVIAADGTLTLSGRGSYNDAPHREWQTRFVGKFSGNGFEASGSANSLDGRTKIRDCTLNLQRANWG